FLRELIKENSETDPAQGESAGTQDKDAIGREAFRIFYKGMEKKMAARGEGTNEYQDFQEYTEYLQQQTS
ncbi:hypothetical protein, partial [Bittarella massiliensis (ex Durand et al. 2017)]